jgi:hypothetical protein
MNPFRPRFRLRTFLIMISLLCVLLMPVSLHFYRLRLQKQAVARLQSKGAHLRYRIEGNEVASYRLKTTRRPENWIEKQWGVEYAYPITAVTAQNHSRTIPISIANDVALLRDLESIEIRGVKLKNADVEPFAKFRRLKSLTLAESVLDDGPLNLLEDLQLTVLNLRRTHVSDRSIRGLQNMQSLTYLNLDRTKVSDASVPLICQLKNLKTLYIGHSKVTKEGALKIVRALPNCQVHWAPLSPTENIPDSVLVDE